MNMNDDEEKRGRPTQFIFGVIVGVMPSMALASLFAPSYFASVIIAIGLTLGVGVLAAKFGDKLWLLILLVIGFLVRWVR